MSLFVLHSGVFAQGGMKSYLEFVRSSTDFSSRYIESTLEWRDDVPDGLEVSIYKPTQDLRSTDSSRVEMSSSGV